MRVVSAQNSLRTFWPHVAWMSGVRLWMVAAQFATSVMIARFWGAESWGILASLNAVVLIFVQLGAFGLSSASTYFVAKEPRRLGTVAVNALIFGLVTGSFLTAVILIFSTDLLLTVAALAITFQLLVLFAQGILLGAGRVKQMTLLDFCNQTLLLVNAAVSVWLWQNGLLRLIILNSITSVVIFLIAATLTYRSQKETGASTWTPDERLLQQMAGFGWKFYLAQLIPTLIIRADLLLVVHYRGAAESGVYAVAGQVGAMLLLLPSVIGARLMPQVAAGRDDSGFVTCSVVRRITGLMLLAHIAIIPFCFLLPFIYGQAFADLPVLVLLLLPGVFLLGLESVLVQHFSGTGFPFRIPVFWFATLVVSLTLNLIFLPKFGAIAAAAVSTICYSLIFVLVARFFMQSTGRTFRETFIFSRV